MERVYERTCGINIRKKRIEATLRVGEMAETRLYGIFTMDIRELTAWLKAGDCQIVGMEGKGPWKPLCSILEMEGLKVLVTTEQYEYLKNVPARGAGVEESEWIALLLQFGLLEAGFVPDIEKHELRELKAYRRFRKEVRAREAGQLLHLLKTANIRLYEFVEDLTGDSARKLLSLLLDERQLTLDAVAALHTPEMKDKSEELYRALAGGVPPLQKEMLREMLSMLQDEAASIERINALIEKQKQVEYDHAARALDMRPGQERLRVLDRDSRELGNWY